MKERTQAMLAESVLEAARKRLVTVMETAPLFEAATLFRAGSDLVVVCGSTGLLTGIVTKTDIVKRISLCQVGLCMVPTSSVMIRDVISCSAIDRLEDVWSTMKARGLKNVPVIDDAGKPIGVLNARDALQVLLQEVQNEELLLRDYVMGIGYG